ncbi:glycoside hydrolase family 18 protein [Candidatus Woesebacteria bacterium]|nr:glycoside hydrolase family 18 protein [Candidatus Woesebacteria bacterium]
MKFGFREYHHSFKHAFSKTNILYLALVVAFLALITSTTYILSQQSFSFGTKAAENTNPLPESYSAPYAAQTSDQKKVIIGFLPSWSVAQHAPVHSEYLDQLIYFGIGMNDQGYLAKVNDQGIETLNWHYFTSDELRGTIEQARGNTKILVSITNFENSSIDKLVSSETATQNAVKSLKNLIKDYNLDGINFNFEYVSDVDYPTHQYLNRFLETVSSELRAEYPWIILSFDVNATAVYNDNAYDMVKIGETMDQVVLMGYDYRQPTAVQAGSVSPLYAQSDAPSIDKSIQSMIGRVPAEKIVLAVPFYGYEWQTYSKAPNSYIVPQTGALATYKRVQSLIEQRDDEELYFDDVSKTPYLIYNQNGFIKQIYYEDDRSLAEKCAYIANNHLDGIGVWALGYEGEYQEPWKVLYKSLGRE